MMEGACRRGKAVELLEGWCVNSLKGRTSVSIVVVIDDRISFSSDHLVGSRFHFQDSRNPAFASRCRTSSVQHERCKQISRVCDQGSDGRQWIRAKLAVFALRFMAKSVRGVLSCFLLSHQASLTC